MTRINEESLSVSYVILVSGKRPESTAALYRSLLDHGQTEQEIILIGDVNSQNYPKAHCIDGRDLAEQGEICKMRNLGIAQAKHSVIALLDDDLELVPPWHSRIRPLLHEISTGRADVGTCRVTGPNGRRWYDWNWASRRNPSCPSMLLPYGKHSPNSYISGCCMIFRKDVWESSPFDERLAYYQRDDIVFCHSLHDRGFKFKCDFRAVATHLLLPAGRKRGDSSYFDRAIYHYRCGDLAEATRLLKKGEMEITPQVMTYYRGLFALFGNDPVGAGQFLSKSLELAINAKDESLIVSAAYRLGLSQLKRNMRNEAIESFTLVVEQVDDHPFALYWLNRLG